jgi:Ca2+-binding RTX toxin-like protein
MLAWQLKGNAQDAQTLFELSSRDEEWVYQDLPAVRAITVAPRDPGPFVKRRSVLFGGEDGDILTGGSEGDRLYGGEGADILDGGQGNDYLEGNAGADELRGGAGDDLLRGGAGADVLQGGKGADRLEGGAGSDHYLYACGDGWDVIADRDGLGRVFYDGQALAGGEQAVARWGAMLATKPCQMRWRAGLP